MEPTLFIPLAHAGHVLADAAIFSFPVGSVLLTIFALRRWSPKDNRAAGDEAIRELRLRSAPAAQSEPGATPYEPSWVTDSAPRLPPPSPRSR